MWKKHADPKGPDQSALLPRHSLVAKNARKPHYRHIKQVAQIIKQKTLSSLIDQ